MGQGDAVWERFGHNLLWIHDPEAGTDEGYNYGLFSFRQENFLLNFVRGRMRYWMQGWAVREQISAYASQGRSIWIQELALGPEKVAELQAFLEWNERPENRFYGYHYYRDNCSTRIRDALDRVLDGRLRAWATERRTDATYRDHTLRLTWGVFWAWAGLHYGMGPSTDHPLTAWEAMFVPMELRDHLRELSVPAAVADSRGSVPLVRSERTLYDAGRAPPPQETPRTLAGAWAVGLLLAGALAGLARAARRGGRGPRLGFAAGAGLWCLFVGALGILLALMWAFTDHVDTHRNMNLFHAGPLHPILALLAAAAVAGRPAAARIGAWVATAAAVSSLLGPLVEAASGPGQVNGEIVAVLLPTNLALAWALWTLRGEGTGPAPAGDGRGGGRTPRFDQPPR